MTSLRRQSAALLAAAVLSFVAPAATTAQTAARDTATVADTPEVRGMIRASGHLLKVEEA